MGNHVFKQLLNDSRNLTDLNFCPIMLSAGFFTPTPHENNLFSSPIMHRLFIRIFLDLRLHGGGTKCYFLTSYIFAYLEICILYKGNKYNI